MSEFGDEHAAAFGNQDTCTYMYMYNAARHNNYVSFCFSRSKPKLPSNMLSMTQLKNMDLPDQVKTLLVNGSLNSVYNWFQHCRNFNICFLYCKMNVCCMHGNLENHYINICLPCLKNSRYTIPTSLSNLFGKLREHSNSKRSSWLCLVPLKHFSLLSQLPVCTRA